MNYAANMVDDDENCELHEPSIGICPLCKYQDDNIIMKMSDVEQKLTGKIDPEEIYQVVCDMYARHTAPLIQQGRQPMKITVEHCREHYTKHVVNTHQQVQDDIHYCCKLQRHYKKNIAVRNAQNANVTLNPHHVNEFVKISKHKLDLVKYLNVVNKRKETKVAPTGPYAFSS